MMLSRAAAQGIFQSPPKLAAAGAIAGLALSQVSALTRKGESPMPSIEGSIRNVAGSAVRSAILTAVLSAALSSGRPGGAMAAAKSGAITGAILGASLTAGQVAGQAGASALGY